MTEMQRRSLVDGDVILHLKTGEAWIVIRTAPRIVAIRAVDVTNSDEWQLLDIRPTRSGGGGAC